MQDLKFIDLFAGAGGFGLGFQLAGLKPLLSVEVDKWASDTLRYNNEHKVVHSDILAFDTLKKIKEICPDSPQVIIGGPPCQGFSLVALNRVKNKEKKNELFMSFFKWVKALKPEVFVIENVPGILRGKRKNNDTIVDTMHDLAGKMGYTLNIWRLNAMDYGVPQSRERVFIVGVKGEVELSKPEATHCNNFSESCKEKGLLSTINIGDAILDLPKIKAREGEEEMDYTREKNLSDYQIWARVGSEKVYNHVAMNHTQRIVSRYEKIMEGVENLPDELKVRKRGNVEELSKVRFNQNYRHLQAKNISYTIPASFYSSFIHPTIPRNITTREAARLQSFPDWYVFQGKRTIMSNSLLKKMGKDEEINLSQYNQVGNAVPPLLAKAVAMRIKEYLNSKK